jgi:GNAT superfamily N-acetyltransferase
VNAGPVIRAIDAGDASRCCELVRACIRRDPSIPGDLREFLLAAETPQTMAERARLFYVAVLESDGSVSGLGGLDLNEIRILCVAPERQGRGLGRRLLRHLEGMVPPFLFKETFVYASLSAAGFYQLHGYQPRGEHLFHIGGRELRTMFMAKGLEGP